MTLWLVATTAPVVSVGIALLPRARSLAAVGLRGTSGRWLLVRAGVGLLGWLINRGVVVLYVWITGDASNPQWPATVAHATNNTLIFVLARLAAELGLLDLQAPAPEASSAEAASPSRRRGWRRRGPPSGGPWGGRRGPSF